MMLYESYYRTPAIFRGQGKTSSLFLCTILGNSLLDLDCSITMCTAQGFSFNSIEEMNSGHASGCRGNSYEWKNFLDTG